MSAPILVTGGTGTIGSRVLPMLRTARQEVRVLSRHPGENKSGITHMKVDTVTGGGLTEALDGVDAVLHLAGGAKGDDTAAQNLTEAAKTARVSHVLISVTRAGTMLVRYFRAKARAAQILAATGSPHASRTWREFLDPQ